MVLNFRSSLKAHWSGTGLWAEPIFPIPFGKWVSTPAVFSTAKSQATCRFCNQPSLSWSSISRPWVNRVIVRQFPQFPESGRWFGRRASDAMGLVCVIM